MLNIISKGVKGAIDGADDLGSSVVSPFKKL